MAEAIKILPPPTPEQHRIAAEQFHRANQVIENGDYDYAIQLLLTCCKLEPANLTFRQALRKTQKTKFQNNLRGSRFAALTTWGPRARMKSAWRSGDFLRVLEYGEQILARNPWNIKVQLRMADAADMLGLLDLAIWILLQAREKDPNDLVVNRALARLCEKRGNFLEAVKLWELVRHVNPKDQEAQSKVKDLAAHHTITHGGYEQAVAGEATSRSGEHRLPKKTESGEPASTDRVAQAAEPLRVRIEADPTNVNNHLDLAGLYRRAGRLDEARKVLQEGLGPTGHDFEMIMELADLEIEPFRQNLALTEDKLRTEPRSEKLQRSRASLIKEINTRELDWFRKKADRFPTEKSYRFEMGIRLFRTGQLDEAIRELQAVRADPRHHWRALMYLGYCFKTRDNWRLAQRNFEEALESLPPAEQATRKELLYQLASGAAEAGDLSRALELGYELANLDFAFRDIGRLVDEWQARLQKVGAPGGKD